MQLPPFFEENFKNLMTLGEFESFKASFEEKRHYGLRINTLKLTPEAFLKLADRNMDPIPWVPQGFFYGEGESFGKHPFYHAGLYYIQEPSAMMPAQVLYPMPGEKVLDLCAAPGGKTTHLGSLMKNEGLLVTNDISPKRVKALVKNVELMGLTNAFVVNETPERLAGVYPEFFDKILLDVPCSGEGMFRKDREAVQSYTRYKSDECVALQREIFKSAYAMLKPGGSLVYSTCTFNPDENERNIEYFTQNYELAVERIEPVGGFEPSRAQWSLSGDEALSGGLRLWPHKARGEGHFVCRLKKGGQQKKEEEDQVAEDYTSKDAQLAAKAFFNFADENLNTLKEGIYHLRGTSLYRLPPFMREVPRVKWDKAGLYLGEYQKGRFEPSQSLIMASSPHDFRRTVRFSREDQRVIRYLKGETLFTEGEKGFTAVLMDHFPLGWGKQDAGMLKNLYPKGWRMM